MVTNLVFSTIQVPKIVACAMWEVLLSDGMQVQMVVSECSSARVWVSSSARVWVNKLSVKIVNPCGGEMQCECLSVRAVVPEYEWPSFVWDIEPLHETYNRNLLYFSSWQMINI